MFHPSLAQAVPERIPLGEPVGIRPQVADPWDTTTGWLFSRQPADVPRHLDRRDRTTEDGRGIYVRMGDHR